MARRKKATMTDRQVIERARRIAAWYAAYTNAVAEDPREAAHVVESHANTIRTLLNQEQVQGEVDPDLQTEFTRTQTEKVPFGFVGPAGPANTGHLSRSGNPAMIVSVDYNE